MLLTTPFTEQHNLLVARTEKGARGPYAPLKRSKFKGDPKLLNSKNVYRKNTNIKCQKQYKFICNKTQFQSKVA